jgi:Protein of unknown function (DUF4232)
MSDRRFDDDLRSVLEEDAPGVVPDELRRRVAAVPTIDPLGMPAAHSGWRGPVPVWIGTLVAVVVIVVLAGAVWRFGSDLQPSAVGGPSTALSFQPSTAPSIAGPTTVSTAPPTRARTPEPSPSPSKGSHPPATPSAAPSAAVAACQSTDLVGRILDWQGAAGSRIADVEVTNTSSRACLVRGTPGLQLVDARGRVLIDSAAAGASGRPQASASETTFDVVAGSRLRTEVAASNYCGAAPTLPIDIAFTLPAAGGRFVATPGTGVSSTDATPPCLGSTPSSISMNGWQK